MEIEPSEEHLLRWQVYHALFFGKVGCNLREKVLLDDLPHQPQHKVRRALKQILAANVDHTAAQLGCCLYAQIVVFVLLEGVRGFDF